MFNKLIACLTLEKMKSGIESTLFGTRFILIPFYLVLAIGMVKYLFVDVQVIYHYLTSTLDEESGTLMVFDLLDMVMVVSVAKMVITGGYTTFVTKDHKEKTENTSSGVLKVKMATALIGVGLIDLVKWMLRSSSINEKILVFAAIVAAAVVLAVIDYLHVRAESIHHEDCLKHAECFKDKH